SVLQHRRAWPALSTVTYYRLSRTAVAASVACSVCRFHPEPDDRRAENVARVEEGGMDTRRDLHLGTIRDSPEVPKRLVGVVCRVQRRVEVDDQVRRLGAPLRLGVPRPGDRAPWPAHGG